MAKKSETKRKIKIPSSNFCSPLISARCVQISAQKLHFLWRNKKKSVFEKNAFLWKIAIFREKRSKFRPIRQKYRFFVFFHYSLNGPQYFSAFQQHCHAFWGSYEPKSTKISSFWTPNFPIKLKNVPTSMDLISGTGDYFATRFAALEPYRKVLRYKINSLFWPWTPPCRLKCLVLKI